MFFDDEVNALIKNLTRTEKRDLVRLAIEMCVARESYNARDRRSFAPCSAGRDYDIAWSSMIDLYKESKERLKNE